MTCLYSKNANCSKSVLDLSILENLVRVERAYSLKFLELKIDTNGLHVMIFELLEEKGNASYENLNVLNTRYWNVSSSIN